MHEIVFEIVFGRELNVNEMLMKYGQSWKPSHRRHQETYPA
jgi:hypothetical protein